MRKTSENVVCIHDVLVSSLKNPRPTMSDSFDAVCFEQKLDLSQFFVFYSILALKTKMLWDFA